MREGYHSELTLYHFVAKSPCSMIGMPLILKFQKWDISCTFLKSVEEAMSFDTIGRHFVTISAALR